MPRAGTQKNFSGGAAALLQRVKAKAADIEAQAVDAANAQQREAEAQRDARLAGAGADRAALARAGLDRIYLSDGQSIAVWDAQTRRTRQCVSAKALGGELLELVVDLPRVRLCYALRRGKALELWQRDLDGSAPRMLVDRGRRGGPCRIAVQPGDGRLFWLEGGRGRATLFTASATGENTRTLVEAGPWVDLATAKSSRAVFYLRSDNGEIHRCDLKGQSSEQVATGSARDMALGTGGRAAFWIDAAGTGIYAGAASQLYRLGAPSSRLCHDPEMAQLYWLASSGSGSKLRHGVWQGSADGSVKAQQLLSAKTPWVSFALVTRIALARVERTQQEAAHREAEARLRSAPKEAQRAADAIRDTAEETRRQSRAAAQRQVADARKKADARVAKAQATLDQAKTDAKKAKAQAQKDADAKKAKAKRDKDRQIADAKKKKDKKIADAKKKKKKKKKKK